jgi:hypothetical protein
MSLKINLIIVNNGIFSWLKVDYSGLAFVLMKKFHITYLINFKIHLS